MSIGPMLRFSLPAIALAILTQPAHAQVEPATASPAPSPLMPLAPLPPGLPLPRVVLEPAVSAPAVPAVPVIPTQELPAPPPPPPGPTAGLPYSTPAPPPDTGDKAPFFGWDDGFYLRSADRAFSLRVTGQLQADYRWYVNDNDQKDIDEFLLRRARFGLEATMFKYYDFRFLPDFGQGQTRLQDGYMNSHYWQEFQFTAGTFKQPFSSEQLIQDRYTPLMERSLIDQLVPQRDMGLMMHGQNLFGNRIDYGMAISNGEQNGDTDTNDSKDFNARVAARPFAGWDDSFLKRFQFGMSGGYGLEHEPANPSSLHTPANVTFFQFLSNVMANGTRWRISPEMAYFVGSFGMSAQDFHMEQKFQASAGAPTVRIPFDGFYVQATYLLTGEERTGYSQQIAPRHPFNPIGEDKGLGAWELVGRVSWLQASDAVFTPGKTQLADPAVSANGATEMTLGYNWYMNKWVRFQFNWEHAWFDRKVKLGTVPNGLLWSQDTIMTRLQFVF